MWDSVSEGLLKVCVPFCNFSAFLKVLCFSEFAKKSYLSLKETGVTLGLIL